MFFEKFENKIPPKITHYTVCKKSSYCGGHSHLVTSLQILKQHAYGSCTTDPWCIHTGSHTMIITTVTYIHAVAINYHREQTWQYRAYKSFGELFNPICQNYIHQQLSQLICHAKQPICQCLAYSKVTYVSRELTMQITNLHSCYLNHKHGCTEYVTSIVTPKPYPINVHLLQVIQ